LTRPMSAYPAGRKAGPNGGLKRMDMRQGLRVFRSASPPDSYVNLENRLGARSDVRRTGTVLSEVNGLLEIDTGYT
jgi:hypothetical protein